MRGRLGSVHRRVDGTRGDRYRRTHHQEAPARGERQEWLDGRSQPGRPRGPTREKERNILADIGGDLDELGRRQLQVVELVSGTEERGGIRTAASQAGADRDPLEEPKGEGQIPAHPAFKLAGRL